MSSTLCSPFYSAPLQTDSSLREFVGGDVVLAAQTALSRTNQLLSPENIETFGQILRNIETITASVDVSELDATKLNDLMDSFTAAANAITATAKSFEETSGSVDSVVQEDVRRLLAKAEDSLVGIDSSFVGFDGTAAGVDVLIADTRDALNRLSNSGLADMEETLDGIRSIVSSLSRMSQSLENSPLEFIAGAEHEEMVLPQ